MLWVCATVPRLAPASTFRVASYNLENYLDVPGETRPAKSSEAKAKVCESILAIRPNVLALQEMGSSNALAQLRQDLSRGGLEFNFSEQITGPDTNIHLVVLSQFPISASHPHTNENFLLGGRRFRVSRGFAELDIRVSATYSFTLLAAHLKSKRAAFAADEAELRLEEARLLREKIDARLAANPNLNLLVAGDFNDTRDSPPLRTIIGRGKCKLVDTRPAERNGDSGGSGAGDSRTVTWTHYYSKEDTYQRIDYILVSPAMAREWVRSETYVLTMPDWGLASDHRPLVAGFEMEDQ